MFPQVEARRHGSPLDVHLLRTNTSRWRVGRVAAPIIRGSLCLILFHGGACGVWVRVARGGHWSPMATRRVGSARQAFKGKVTCGEQKAEAEYDDYKAGGGVMAMCIIGMLMEASDRRPRLRRPACSPRSRAPVRAAGFLAKTHRAAGPRLRQPARCAPRGARRAACHSSGARPSLQALHTLGADRAAPPLLPPVLVGALSRSPSSSPSTSLDTTS